MKRLGLMLVLLALLLAACTPAPPPVDTSAPEVDAAYAAFPVLENDLGQKLQVGMSAADFAQRTGVLPEDGWQTLVREGELAVTSMDGTVVTLAVGKPWKVVGGVCVGDTAEQVRAVCGEPAEDFTAPTDPPILGGLTYQIGDQGQAHYKHKGDGVIDSIIFISTAGADDVLLGYENARATGDGKQTITEFSKYNATGEYLLISYAGKGDFTLIATGADGKEKTLVSETGPYEGRVDAPGFAPYGLKVSAKGNWMIQALVDAPLQGPMKTLPS